jgi:hypothetical protein
LFLHFVVLNIFLRLLGNTRHNWLLSRVLLIITHLVTETREIHLHFIHGLALVQTDLDATIAGANTAEVILLYGGADHVLASAHLL